jgi:hypothetical protein
MVVTPQEQRVRRHNVSRQKPAVRQRNCIGRNALQKTEVRLSRGCLARHTALVLLTWNAGYEVRSRTRTSIATRLGAHQSNRRLPLGNIADPRSRSIPAAPHRRTCSRLACFKFRFVSSPQAAQRRTHNSERIHSPSAAVVTTGITF